MSRQPEFYIDESPNGARYYINKTIVSREEFIRRQNSMNIPELTPFQLDSLKDSAASPTDSYLMVLSSSKDTPEQIALWDRNNRETDQLIEMGLIEDISPSFAQQIEHNIVAHGRAFRVLRSTKIGKAMFNESTNTGALSN